MISFLQMNGIYLDFTDKELIEVGLSLASHKMEYKDLLIWIKKHRQNI